MPQQYIISIGLECYLIQHNLEASKTELFDKQWYIKML